MKFFGKRTNAIIGLVIAGIVILGIGVAAVSAIGNKKADTISSGPSVDINKTFSAIGRTKDGRPTDGSIPIKITNAQLTESVLVQGEKASTRNGKIFLVVYLEAENKYQVGLFVNPLDLLRLVRSDGKRIAPSVSQGNVEIRPISVKRTNVAFVVDRTEKNFTLEIGEVRGTKEAVQINFK